MGSIISLFVFLGFSAAPLHLTDVSSLLGGLPLSFLKPVCISCWSVLPRPLVFSPLASFPSQSFKFSFAHLTFPGVHSPALPYKRHFLDCSVITCPVYAVVFAYLSHPPSWKLITISWYIFEISHPIRKNQDCWNPFPFQFSNEETCGFFGQVVRGASRQKSWR